MPAPFIEGAMFAPLYILASFVKNKVLIDAWVYFWAFYLVPLLYVFVLVPYCLDDCSFVAKSEVRKADSPALFFLKTALSIQSLLHFHMNCEIFCSSSVKNVIGNLLGIILNL